MKIKIDFGYSNILEYIKVHNNYKLYRELEFNNSVIDWLASMGVSLKADHYETVFHNQYDIAIGPGHILLKLPDEIVPMFLLRFPFHLCNCIRK